MEDNVVSRAKMLSQEFLGEANEPIAKLVQNETYGGYPPVVAAAYLYALNSTDQEPRIAAISSEVAEILQQQIRNDATAQESIAAMGWWAMVVSAAATAVQLHTYITEWKQWDFGDDPEKILEHTNSLLDAYHKRHSYLLYVEKSEPFIKEGRSLSKNLGSLLHDIGVDLDYLRIIYNQAHDPINKRLIQYAWSIVDRNTTLVNGLEPFDVLQQKYEEALGALHTTEGEIPRLSKAADVVLFAACIDYQQAKSELPSEPALTYNNLINNLVTLENMDTFSVELAALAKYRVRVKNSGREKKEQEEEHIHAYARVQQTVSLQRKVIVFGGVRCF